MSHVVARDYGLSLLDSPVFKFLGLIDSAYNNTVGRVSHLILSRLQNGEYVPVYSELDSLNSAFIGVLFTSCGVGMCAVGLVIDESSLSIAGANRIVYGVDLVIEGLFNATFRPAIALGGYFLASQAFNWIVS